MVLIMKVKINNKFIKTKPTIKDYKEAIQILMVDYADVWEKTKTFKEKEKIKNLLRKRRKMDINQIDKLLNPEPKALTKIYGTMGICLGEEL